MQICQVSFSILLRAYVPEVSKRPRIYGSGSNRQNGAKTRFNVVSPIRGVGAQKKRVVRFWYDSRSRMLFSPSPHMLSNRESSINTRKRTHISCCCCSLTHAIHENNSLFLCAYYTTMIKPNTQYPWYCRLIHCHYKFGYMQIKKATNSSKAWHPSSLCCLP